MTNVVSFPVDQLVEFEAMATSTASPRPSSSRRDMFGTAAGAHTGRRHGHAPRSCGTGYWRWPSRVSGEPGSPRWWTTAAVLKALLPTVADLAPAARLRSRVTNR
jgi:hypothetical protein